MIHHHNLETECKNEKYSLIKLLALFKSYLFNLLKKCEISKEILDHDEDFKKLKCFYQDIEKKMIDPDFFFMTLGENFDDMPKSDYK